MIDKSSISVNSIDGRVALKTNGVLVDEVFRSSYNNYGLHIRGKDVFLNDSKLASSKTDNPSFVYRDELLMFGDAVIGGGACINVTLENFNNMLDGAVNGGYARHSSSRIYNIVETPSTSPLITYVDNGDTITFSTGITARKTYAMIYNSVAGTLPENTEDLDATVMGDAPFVNIRYFEPIIKTGDGLTLEYFVDNRDMDSMNSLTIGDTFTTIIKLANGVEYKKTSYAGFNYIELPAFSTSGETWFSVRCIDNNGVSSVEQFFDILVRGSVTENHYKMTAADLETYGIVPDNSDPQVAFANKSALSSFFAAVKEGGYNGVKILNRTYWVDYHATFGTQRYWRASISSNTITSLTEITEQDVIDNNYTTTVCTSIPSVGSSFTTDSSTLTLVYNTSTDGAYITFPNEFTVDLNGATINATQCTDLHWGSIIRINGNYDTHIKNGIIIGNYSGFDFETTRRRCGKPYPSEGLSLTGFTNYAKYCSFENLDISYSTGYEFGSGGNYGGFDYLSMDNGEEGKRVDLSNGELVDEAGCVVSSWLDLKNATTVAIGRSGQGSYQGGTRREILLSFYDSNKTYISTIKTKLYYISKIPTGAKYMKMTGYGTKAQWPLYGGSGVLGVNRNPAYPTNIKVKNCSWHDTRTCAFTLAGCNGFRVEGCHWTNIALETGTYQVTKILGDFEDGWQRTRNVYVDGCTAVAGIGMNKLLMTYCNKLEWTNNTGFHVESSGIEDGLFMDNSFPYLSIGRNFRSMNPHVVYLRNTIGTLSVSYEDGSGNTYNTGHVDKVVPMIDSTIKNTCSYSDLLMRNSKNGVILID